MGQQEIRNEVFNADRNIYRRMDAHDFEKTGEIKSWKHCRQPTGSINCALTLMMIGHQCLPRSSCDATSNRRQRGRNRTGKQGILYSAYFLHFSFEIAKEAQCLTGFRLADLLQDVPSNWRFYFLPNAWPSVLSNDGMFGDTSGPDRISIDNPRPLANSGSSPAIY